MPRIPVVAAVFVCAAACWTTLVAQRMDAFVESRHHPAIAYGRGAFDNPVADLNARLADGDATLEFDAGTGYLRATLDALGISPDSQLLVFSPTSFQASHIAYDNPRAIYFNDTVAVGWIRGAPLLELTAQDPRHGTVFYSIGQSPTDRPTFGRQEQCVSCHLTWDTLGVPGLTIRTTSRRADGELVNGGPVDHRRPFAERWSGWFVTGAFSPGAHLGNRRLVPGGSTPPAAAGGLASISGEFDTTGYLRTTSDAVALMVLEHQTQAANMSTRAGWEARLGDPVRTRAAAEALADYLLFVDEAPLPQPLLMTGAFAGAFPAGGPRDSHGRSLRDLRLDGRLMQYPLSYMVYTPMFEALPRESAAIVHERLAAVLDGRDASPKYAHLTPDLRRAIVEILRETRPALAAGVR
ncbi:MAG: hypothetical protein R2712_22095 [Vicinamibacterales bacterium]